MAKDLFSKQSESYAKYRPDYPPELFNYILQFVRETKSAWDCATGNGQAANMLANYFETVKASDISEAQIKNAVQKENIEYLICPEEQTPFDDNSFDLITVAQAYHWLNWKKFHDEATRVGKPNSVVAIWTYITLVSDDQRLNGIIEHFYRNITGPYWDYERKYVDEAYSTVDFKFDPLPSQTFETKLTWTKDMLVGFLQSWSSVQNYIKAHHSNPIDLIQKDIDGIWKEHEEKQVRFPIFLRIGRIVK
jgi:ubiquinone/menaquinone biosynthesis C-methylase UbiE